MSFISTFLEFTVLGIIAGSIYALVASGFSLIYSTNRFMHFAHGATIVAAGYLLFWFFSILGIHIVFAVIFTLILSGVLGVVMYRLVYSPLQNKKASNVILLIASIGILILIENLILMIFGGAATTIDVIKVTEGLPFLGTRITWLQIITIDVSLVLLVGLYAFMKKTKIGRNMRAVSENKELASIIGINQKRVSDISFLIGSVLAGVAGIFIGLMFSLTPSMGTNLIIKGFTGAVIGGIASVPGSIIGSYILGLAENWGIMYLDSSLKDAIAFILLVLFLIFRPNGLFGRKKGVKDT